MPLYHRDIGIPDDVIVPVGQVYLSPSSHAVNEAQNDRYLRAEENSLDIPNSVHLTEDNVFEVKAVNGTIKKLGCRVPYDDERDLVLILIPDGGAMCDPLNPWTVKTVWVNVVDDTHETLDPSAYAEP